MSIERRIVALEKIAAQRPTPRRRDPEAARGLLIVGCLLAHSGAWQRAEELPRPLLKDALADALGYGSVAAMEEAELRSPVTVHSRLEARARNMLTAAGATQLTMKVAEKLFQAVPHSLRRRLHLTELSEFAGELP